jgi:hypothetical protein
MNARRSWGSTIFCDDIRPEAGGKLAFMGVYPSAMNVHDKFPVVLAKFGMWIRYFEVPGAVTGDAKLKIYLPGDTEASVEADIPLTELRTSAMSSSPDPNDPDAEVWHLLQMPVVLAPMVLNQEGRIKVRLEVDDQVIRLGAIEVSYKPRAAGENTPPA